MIDLTQPAADLTRLKKEPVTIKEGVDYSVGISFVWVGCMKLELMCSVENEIASGLKYIQVVKRAGITVDRTEAMLGCVAEV